MLQTFALIATLITPQGQESFLIDYNLSGVDCIEAMLYEADKLGSHGLILSCEFYYDDEPAEGFF